MVIYAEMTSKFVVRLFMAFLPPKVKDSDEDHAEQDHNGKVDGKEDPDIGGDFIKTTRPYRLVTNVSWILVYEVTRLPNEASEWLRCCIVHRVYQENDKGDQVGPVQGIAGVEVLVLYEGENE